MYISGHYHKSFARIGSFCPKGTTEYMLGKLYVELLLSVQYVDFFSAKNINL